jgi:hypothetical protein
MRSAEALRRRVERDGRPLRVPKPARWHCDRQIALLFGRRPTQFRRGPDLYRCDRHVQRSFLGLQCREPPRVRWTGAIARPKH